MIQTKVSPDSNAMVCKKRSYTRAMVRMRKSFKTEGRSRRPSVNGLLLVEKADQTIVIFQTIGMTLHLSAHAALWLCSIAEICIARRSG